MVSSNTKNKTKKLRSKVIQNGGVNIVTASVDIIKSMIGLGQSIFTEIDSITNIQSDINNGASPSQGTPNQVNGPPPFNAPTLNEPTLKK
jgi:hypothetical protein